VELLVHSRAAREDARVISTHVLDTGRGIPAQGVRVELYAGDELVGSGQTDGDGRIRQLADAAPGSYRLVFHPDSPVFRRVEVEVVIEDGRDYHVPLLLSPYACAIYRGS
jgi:5-hydroxyisourate hydrolase